MNHEKSVNQKRQFSGQAKTKNRRNSDRWRTHRNEFKRHNKKIWQKEIPRDEESKSEKQEKIRERMREL